MISFGVLVYVLQQAFGMEVYEGADLVVLPCLISPVPLNPTVVWSQNEMSPSTVHQRDPNGDNFKFQNQHYSGRTSMRIDSLTSGDLSLSIRKLNISDSGNYTCTIKAFGNEQRLAEVNLRVKEIFPSWVKVLLVLLALLVVAGGLLVYFRQNFMSVYQVEVESGEESVLLPCKTTVCLSADIRVEWKERENRTVHVYENGSDQPEEQDSLYRGRTEMKRNLFRTGDVCLRLKNPTDKDKGTLICTIYNREGNILMKKQVVLKVKVQQVEVESGVESVLLPCKTKVHLPADVRVEWSDGYRIVHVYQNNSDQVEEQNCSYRGRTKMMRNLLRPRDVSLTLKYPTDRDNYTFTCTIYNKEGNIMMKKQVKIHVRICQVEVKEGAESVLLPFRTTENLPEEAMVEWTKYEPEHMKVHVYQNNLHLPEEQNDFYRDRTEMKENLLESGDVSLTLKNPAVRDTGRYVSDVWMEGNIIRVKTVVLTVKERTQGSNEPVDIEENTNSTDPTPLMAEQSV